MDRLLQDLRFGFRTLLGSPLFTLVAVVTLALGIGATSSVVTVVNAVFLEGLPYPEADRLVTIEGEVTTTTEDGDALPVSYLDFLDYRERNTVLDEIVLYAGPRSFNLMSDGEPERLPGEMVTSGYFAILGIEPDQGRFFTREEDQHPAGNRVVVVSRQLWERRFGVDARLSGQTLTVNDQEYQIVGVAPRTFSGMTDEALLWMPVVEAARTISPPYIEVRAFRWLSALGRLKDGVSLERAKADLDGIVAALAEEHPQVHKDTGVRLTPLAESWFGDLEGGLAALLAGAALVLLMACFNVANLLLARATARQREMAVRLANGAGRGRLVRQLLTESLLLAGAGLLLGLLLARLATRAMVAASAVDFQSFVSFETDGTVLALAAVTALLSVLVFGLVPALMASRADLAEVLKEGGGGTGGSRSRQRVQSALVVVEVAVAVILLVGAGLLLQRFASLQGTRLGFDTDGLLTVRADLQGPRYAGPQVKAQLARQLYEAVTAESAFDSAALMGPGIPTDDWYGSPFTAEERVREGLDDMILSNFHSVTPGTFATLGVPLLEGRDFRDTDVFQGPTKMIVSRAAAEAFWPGESPVGKNMKIGGRSSPSPWSEVIGMVENVQHRGLSDEESGNPDVYYSFLQFPSTTPPIYNFLIRPAGGRSAESMVPVLRRIIDEVEPSLPLYDAATMEQRLSDQLSRDRFLLLVAALFAFLALVIAAVGIYGVLAFAVAERSREIGIRMALGAGQGRVVRDFLRRGAILAGIGLAVGVVGAVAAALFARRLVPDLSLGNPLAFAGACVVLFLVAVAASYLPARKAARVAPAVTLRSE